jgi:flagellar basal-body rod protein FlgB
MANPITQYTGFHADAMQLREQRLKLIASNLANADTPGYQAQDMDFTAAMDAANRQRQGLPPTGTGLVATHENHLSDAIDTGRLPFQYTRQAAQPSLDGNTVDPDAERAAYGRAALEYRASMSFFESKVRGLLTAITGQ